MLDFSVSELILIAVVALVVIGPERLPKVARTAGVLLSRLQRYVAEVKADVSRELELEDLKKLKSEMQDAAHSVQHSISQQMSEVENQMRGVEQEVSKAAEEARGTFSPSIPYAAPMPPEPPAASEAPALSKSVTAPETAVTSEPSPQLELSLESSASAPSVTRQP